jgi:hypothetical protein
MSEKTSSKGTQPKPAESKAKTTTSKAKQVDLEESIEEVKQESKGLGDTVAKVTKATGIDKLVKFLAGEDCGCDKRQEALNKLFPYKRPDCLTEDEHDFLTGFFADKNQHRLSRETANKLVDIYNRVFAARQNYTSCAPCMSSVVDNLRKVFETYEK